MPVKKTTKAAEAKKTSEAKTKKTTKTTKTAAKTKTTSKTKRATSRKKPVEEELITDDELEKSPETETEVEPEPEPEPEPEQEGETELVPEPEFHSEYETEQEVYAEPEEEPDSELEQEEPAEKVKEHESPEEMTEVESKQDDQASEDVKEEVDDEKINAHRIFITRIAFEATKEDLEEYFKQFGTVYDAYCPRQNSYSALNKGFGFISFDSEETIQKVFDAAPHIIMGREVIVDRATGTKYHTTSGGSTTSNPMSQQRRPFTPYNRRYRDYPDNYRYKRYHDSYADYPNKFVRRDRHYERDNFNPPQQYRQGTGNQQQGGFDPNKPVSYVFPASRSENRNHDAMPRTYSNTVKSNRDRNIPKLFVGRLGQETTGHHLRSYFSQFGEVVDVYVPRDTVTQKGKGFGFLTFANKSAIHTVLDPNLRHVLDGRELIVDYADVHTRRL